MKNAITANVTMLIMLSMMGILFLSTSANAYACCYVGCPAKHPNCQACVKVNSGKCGPKGACNASACGHGPMDDLVAGSTAGEREVAQAEERAGEEHPRHGNAKAIFGKRRARKMDSGSGFEAGGSDNHYM